MANTSYFSVLTNLVTCKKDVFQLAVDGKSRKFVIFNIIILGIFFGLSNFAGTPDLPLEGKFAIITPLIFFIAGISTMVLALVGLGLVYWSAARAFGGPGGPVLIFDLLGLVAVPFWIMVPLLNYGLRFNGTHRVTLPLLVIIALTAAWSFRLLRGSLIVGQGLGRTKATLAVCGIWIFSVSSIYVFTP